MHLKMCLQEIQLNSSIKNALNVVSAKYASKDVSVRIAIKAVSIRTASKDEFEKIVLEEGVCKKNASLEIVIKIASNDVIKEYNQRGVCKECILK